MTRLASCLVFLSLIITAQAERVVKIKSQSDLAAAARLLAAPAARDAESLVVQIAPGDYVLRDTLRILRSNVSVLAEPGVRLRLADGVNQPVIAIGSQRETPLESERIERIRISGFEVDGNRSGQASEVGLRRSWIRNNGIDVRMVKFLVIDRMRVTSCRSGGLVISWKSSDVSVRNSEFADNFFDGVAYYDSERIETIRCAMKDNDSAGVSADNHFSRSRFIDCEMAGNGDVGVFLRSSREIVFDHCSIDHSGDWGAFLAHNESGDGVHRIRFRKCHFFSNNGGVRMASASEAQSSGTEVARCIFQKNNARGRANIATAGSAVRSKKNREHP